MVIHSGDFHSTATARLFHDGAASAVYQRDFWAAAEGLYEHFPLLGALLRWLERRAG